MPFHDIYKKFHFFSKVLLGTVVGKVLQGYEYFVTSHLIIKVEFTATERHDKYLNTCGSL